MRYELTPNQPRPTSAVIAGCASDARWRDVPVGVDAVDTLDVLRAARHDTDWLEVGRAFS